MEKWALKLGLKFEQTESDTALHWLTSAIGGDPALTGLFQLERRGTLLIGAAWHLSLGQERSKSSAKEERQDPDLIGLKICGPIVDKKSQTPVKIGLNCVSAKVCYTRPNGRKEKWQQAMSPLILQYPP